MPTTPVRAAVCSKRVCSQAVPQLPPFLHQAFSAFFYTVDFIQTVMGRPVHLPSDLKDAAMTICATSWSEVGTSGMAGGEGRFVWGITQALSTALGGGWVSWHPWSRGRVGDDSHMGPGEAQVGMGSTLASQMQPHRASGHRNKAQTLLA